MQKRREEKFRGVEKCKNPFEEAVSLRFLTLAKGRLEKICSAQVKNGRNICQYAKCTNFAVKITPSRRLFLQRRADSVDECPVK